MDILRGSFRRTARVAFVDLRLEALLYPEVDEMALHWLYGNDRRDFCLEDVVVVNILQIYLVCTRFRDRRM